MTKHPKRPRDPNQLAKLIVDIATGQVEDREPTPEEQGKDPAAVSLGRRGGLKDGLARSAKMTGEQRAEAARTVIKINGRLWLGYADVSERKIGCRFMQGRVHFSKASRNAKSSLPTRSWRTLFRYCHRIPSIG